MREKEAKNGGINGDLSLKKSDNLKIHPFIETTHKFLGGVICFE